MARKASKPITDVALYDEELAKYAAIANAVEAKAAGTGQFITAPHGNFKYKGEMIGKELSVVVVASCFENSYYEGAFDAENPMPPVCFALNEDGEKLAPHEKSIKKQHPTCEGCWANEWGSDPGGGRGKACQNKRRLGLVFANDEEDLVNITDAEVGYFRTPVTSTKAYANYTVTLAKMKPAAKPPFAVITHIDSKDDEKTSFRIGFAVESIIPLHLIGPVIEKHKDVMKSIAFPYEPPSAEQLEAAAAPRGRTRGNAAGRQPKFTRPVAPPTKPAANKPAAKPPTKQAPPTPTPPAGTSKPASKRTPRA